jgi:hypothetical protein
MTLTIRTCCLAILIAFAGSANAAEAVPGNDPTNGVANCESGYPTALLRSRGLSYRSHGCGNDASTAATGAELVANAEIDPEAQDESACSRSYRNAVLQARRISYAECII